MAAIQSLTRQLGAVAPPFTRLLFVTRRSAKHSYGDVTAQRPIGSPQRKFCNRAASPGHASAGEALFAVVLLSGDELPALASATGQIYLARNLLAPIALVCAIEQSERVDYAV